MSTIKNSEKPKKAKRRRVWKIILVSLLVILIIVRLILPHFVLKYVNKKLSEIKEYQGHVDDIDLALIRGAYVINDIVLYKVDSAKQRTDSIPFFKCPKIDLSVQWKAIFKGSIVGEIYLDDPELNFVKGKHKGEDVKADTSDFRKVIKDLMPLTVNHFEITRGQIHYIDKSSSPKVDIAMKNIEAKAENLSNVNDSSKLLPATLRGTGDIYGGTFQLNVKFDALKNKPTFDMDARLDNMDMVQLNSFFMAYGKFEVEKGNMGLYTEFAAKDGLFKGYVKPILKDLKVKIGKKGDNIGDVLWETLVAGIGEVFKNWKKDQVATKIPIEGRFDKPETGLWTAINYVLRNAFVYALRPSIDNTIDIGKVEAPPPEKKTFLQKLFGKKDENKKDKKKKK